MIWLLSAARAQELGGFDAHGFSVAGHQGNPRGWLGLAAPSAGWRGAWEAGVVFDYADDPLVETVGGQSIPVLDQVLGATLVGGASILGFARVDAALPFYPFAVDQSGSFAALGDLRVEGNLPLVTEKGLRPGLSLLPQVWAPTGTETRFLGDAGFGFGGRVAVEQRIGPVAWALNAGARVGPPTAVRNVEWGTSLVAGLGLQLALGEQGAVGAELIATPSLDGQLPMEALGQVRYRLPFGLYALAGGGAGLTGGIGASRFRVVAGFGWSALGEAPAEDTDGDGLSGAADRCPTEAEDRDGWQDDDGCVDPDDDADGTPDRADGCPKVAEDPDGYADGDGCPEQDADADGIGDGTDNCPEQAEDRDGVIDGDGCPDGDADADGVADEADRCPAELEDRDGDADEDGCADVDADRDADGVVDRRDRCPDEALRPGQDPGSSDGCPRLAEIRADKIVITDKIYFQEGKALLLPESRPVLEAVRDVLQEHPEIRDLLVEGHTDDVGDEEQNYRLSEARAKAVADWLVKAGVDRNRIAAKGYGESRPLLPNETDANRAQNRRVEFTIVKRD